MAAIEKSLKPLSVGAWSNMASSYSFQSLEPSYAPQGHRNIEWIAIDGDVFPIFYCHNAGSKERDGCIIVFFHGNMSDLGDNVDFLTRLCANCRCSMFSIEYPGYGGSPGTADERSVNLRMLRGLEFISQKFKVPFARMILVGHSIGAAVLLGVASQNPDAFGGVMLLNTFSTLAEIASDVMQRQFGVGVFGKIAGAAFDNVEMISKLTRTPIFIYHCSEDEVIAVEHAHSLYAAVRSNSRFLYIQEGGGHARFDFKQLDTKIICFVQIVQKLVKSQPRIGGKPDFSDFIDPTDPKFGIAPLESVRISDVFYFD